MWSKKFEKCVRCKNTRFRHLAKGYCIKCYRESLRRKCSICKKFNVTSTRKNGKVVCTSCNKKYFSIPKKRICSICGKLGRIDRVSDNKPICMSCNQKYYYKRPKSICGFCGKLRVRTGFKGGKPICGYCYRKTYTKPKKICDNCGRLDRINIIIEGKKYCRKCYKSEIRKEYYLALNHIRTARIKKIRCNINEEAFKKIIERDKVCVYCGSDKDLTFDHIKPISKGGKSEFNNYVLACKKCNFSKNNRNVFGWCNYKMIEVPKIIIKLKGQHRRVEPLP